MWWPDQSCEFQQCSGWDPAKYGWGHRPVGATEVLEVTLHHHHLLAQAINITIFCQLRLVSFWEIVYHQSLQCLKRLLDSPLHWAVAGDHLSIANLLVWNTLSSQKSSLWLYLEKFANYLYMQNLNFKISGIPSALVYWCIWKRLEEGLRVDLG